MKPWGFFFAIVLMLGCDRYKAVKSNEEGVSNNFSVSDGRIETFTQNGAHKASSIEVKTTPKRVVILSTPIMAFFEVLGVDSVVKGMMYSERVFGSDDDLVEVGLGNEISIEKILSVKPDLIICNSYQRESLKRIASAIDILVVDEYEESNPVKKASWLLLFGALFDKEELAAQQFNEIKSGFKTRPEIDKLVVQLNNYDGVWYVPGCESYITSIIKGAGLKTFCDEAAGNLGTTVSNEKAKVILNDLDFLLFFDYSESQDGIEQRLTEANRSLVEYKKLRVLYCNTIQSNYFQESILKPNLVVEDLRRVVETEKEGKFFKLVEIER